MTSLLHPSFAIYTKAWVIYCLSMKSIWHCIRYNSNKKEVNTFPVTVDGNFLKCVWRHTTVASPNSICMSARGMSVVLIGEKSGMIVLYRAYTLCASSRDRMESAFLHGLSAIFPFKANDINPRMNVWPEVLFISWSSGSTSVPPGAP